MEARSGVAPAAVSTREVFYPLGEGAQKARIYTLVATKDAGPLPVGVHHHGGGWVIADIQAYDATPRTLSKALNTMVISVEHRHAPEHKLPAQHEDALAAYRWVLKTAAWMNGDPLRIAFAGESAGGATSSSPPP